MDIENLTDDQLDDLASKLAGRLPTGRHGDQFVLSRRQLLSVAGGSAGVAGLVALGVDPVAAQSAAGQVGTSSEPVDVFGATVDVDGGEVIDGSGTSHTGELADASDTASVSSTSTTDGYELTVNGDTYEFIE